MGCSRHMFNVYCKGCICVCVGRMYVPGAKNTGTFIRKQRAARHQITASLHLSSSPRVTDCATCGNISTHPPTNQPSTSATVGVAEGEESNVCEPSHSSQRIQNNRRCKIRRGTAAPPLLLSMLLTSGVLAGCMLHVARKESDERT